MLCRRCGMESSTTDKCEWCKRPMLPPGATVSAEAAKELKRSGRPIVQPTETEEQEPPGLPLVQQSPEEEEAEPNSDQESAETLQYDAGGTQLRPLGGVEQQTSASSPLDPTPPTHGVSEDATKTSIDISQYLGADQSIFRPIEREEAQKSAASDLLAQKARGLSDERDGAIHLSENARLGRAAIAGIAIGLLFAVVQFFVAGSTVTALYGLRLGASDSLMTVVKFGILSGLIFGVGLGAILVKLRKGSFLGALMGIMVGLGFSNLPWSPIAGAAAGVLAGRFATIGVRRVVNV